MKLRVTLIISLLVALATGMTFFVVTSFWLRESALGLAKEKESAVSFRVEQQSRRWQQYSSEREYLSFLLELNVESSGALGGCVLSVGHKPICRGETLATYQSTLEQLLAETKQSRSGIRSLSGLEWLAFPPYRKYLDIGVHVNVTQQPNVTLALRYSLDTHFSSVRAMQRSIFGYLGFNFIILVILGFFRLREQFFRPVERMIRMTDSYRDESGVPFLAIQGSDELGQLSASMQQMLARIKTDREKLQQHVASLETANRQLIATREEMVRSEKLSSVGRLAAGLAHEIGNPIGIVQGYLSLIQQQDLSAQEKQDFCGRAEQELQRISQLVRRLLDLSRPGSGDEQKVDVHLVLDEVVSLLRPQPLMDGIDIRVSLLAEESLLRSNADQLLQVFLNCLINAADAMPTGKVTGRGVIEISTDVDVEDSCRNLRVVISDTGTGLDHEVLANAFDPFFTTKEPGKGTGLGLSVSYALIKGMGGKISLANREGGGAVVSIVLPVVKE